MAIKLPDGKVARTLPEQVKKNMEDITAIDSEVNVIKESISTAYKIQGSATVADLNGETIEESMNGYVYNMTDAGSLNNDDGTTTSVQIGDNVVLIWNNGDYFWDRLSGLVDTSDLVTLSTDQTITGLKTFNNQINFYNSVANVISGIQGTNYGGIDFKIGNSSVFLIESGAIYSRTSLRTTNSNADLGSSSYTWRDLYLSGVAYLKDINSPSGTTDITIGNTSGVVNCRATFRPATNNARNLGSSSLLWKDAYIAGNLTNGTNSVTVAQISKTKLYIHLISFGAFSYNVVMKDNTNFTGSTCAAAFSGEMVISAINITTNAQAYHDGSGNFYLISGGSFLLDAASTDTIALDVVTEY